MSKVVCSGTSFGTLFGTVLTANEPRISAAAVISVCHEPGCHTIFQEASPTFKKRFMYMSGITDEDEFDKMRQGMTWEGHADKVKVPYLCVAGEFDDDDGPVRLHGDLWSGNLLWTPDGVVLIDPAAHGGHRETDLAILALFGCPHLHAVIDGYRSVHPLREGWPDRTPLHQLYPLLAHVVLFGGGYARQIGHAVRTVVKLS